MSAAAAARRLAHVIAPLVLFAATVAVSDASAASGGKDRTPPTASITAPAGGNVSGSVVITAAATDNVAVAAVRFYVDGIQIGNRDVTAPYAQAWNSSSVSGGVHVLTAVARDSSGNSTTSAPVTVQTGDATPPSTPTNLATSAISGTSVTLSWAGSNDNVGVTGYLVYVNGAQVGTSFSNSYAFGGLACGTTYTLGVAAEDAADNISAVSTASAATAACPDTTPPSAPTGLATSAVTQTSAALSWSASTDNVGVSGYRLSLNGNNVGSSTSTAYTFVGLTCGTTYTLGVAALDAAGNASAVATISTQTAGCPDTTPPSAPGTVTASVAGTTEIDLSWGAATDNVAVTSYQIFRCLGAGCTSYTLIAQPAGTAYKDASLSAGTSSSYQVRAVDATGNVGAASNTVTATTQSTAPALVAAYSFDETSGSTVADSSGNGNTGTISNAVRTASGKFGGALVFNGSNARVDVADSSSLHLSSGMTLEAWVNPTTVASAWRDVVYKGNDNYYLSGTTDHSGFVGGGGTFAGANANAFGSSMLPTNTWSHLAVTYDGATMRVYLNGALVASVAATGPISSSASQLQIGGDSVYGQYFSGLIDEVRVYNQPLSQAAIQADMTAPVGGGTSSTNSTTSTSSTSSTTTTDTTAPSAPSGLATSAVGQASITLSWSASTDNVGVAGYRLFRGASQIATATTTSFAFTGLTCGTTYSLGVAAVDAAGNVSSTASVNATTTPCSTYDTTAPSTPPGVATSGLGQTSATLSWSASTDNVGVTGYRMFVGGSQVGTSFSTSYVFGGLSCGTSYTLGVAAVDAAGNVSGTASVSITTTACSSGTVAGTLYVAQNAAGSADGGSCANAKAATFFNTASNWGAGKPIAPGAVVALCGTIASTLTAQGSGAAGNPITISFTSGARISQSACTPCLELSNRSYLIVDGGANGIIESTNNGTNLGLHQNSTGIDAVPCDNCEIKNLTIQNIYVHAGSNNEIDQTQMRSIFANGSNLTIDHNVIHDAGWSVFIAMGNGNHDIHIDHNDIYNVDHGLITSSGTVGGNFGPIWFNNNHVHDFGNWDTSNNAYHHDGIHCYTVAGGQPMHISDYYIYDNRFDGSIGGNATSWIFMEAGSGTSATPCADPTSRIWVFNNYGYTDHNLGNGVFGLFSGRNYVYNNTLVGNNTSATGQPQIVLAAGSSFSGSGELENNVLSTGNQVPSFSASDFPAASRDYNVYANSGGNWYCNGFLSTYAQWQTCMGGDSHSNYNTSAQLNLDGTPQATSPALNAGANLTSRCTGNLVPLCSDINGTPRPATGAWSVGAFK